MEEINIKWLAYTLYKIDWLRRISPERMMDFVKNWYDDRKIDANDTSTLQEIYDEFGFDGESYACYEEFLDAEYRDKEYIKSLLNESQYKEYLADLEHEDDEQE